MESINRPELVKEHNLALVRKTLFTFRQATRQQLSASTGISTVTLGNLLQQLLETGEALEGNSLQPASGRPARVYAYNARRMYGLLVWVVRENGENVFRTVLTDLYGDTVWEDQSPARCLNSDETRRFFRHLLHLRGTVGAVTVGLPGVGFGDYFHRNNPPYFSLETLEAMQKAEGFSLRIENDVNLAAVGYARRHEADPEETMAYLYLMRGAYGGSAIYLKGALHLGRDRYAGELLPAPFGTNWSRMEPDPPERLDDALLSTVLPYLTILAPHRFVIASDYIRPEHLERLEARAAGILEKRNCPRFLLSADFKGDYREGLKQLILEKLKEEI